MDLDNLVKVVVQHLLIGGTICLGYYDAFSMVRALVYMMYTRHDLL